MPQVACGFITGRRIINIMPGLGQAYAYYISNMLSKNSLGLLKKGVAKQSRIKSIAWHLRWLVRTRADVSLRPNVSLQPSGLVRPRTDIKLRPRAFVRTRTDFKLQTVGIGKIIQGLIQEQVYTQIFLNCHLAAFLHPIQLSAT